MKFYTYVTALLLMSSAIASTPIANKATIQLNPKQKQFEIMLSANPTTGYQWKLVSYDKNLVKLLNSQYQKSVSNRIGAGGQMVFTFSVNNKASGKTTLFFKYARPWEAKGATKKQVTVLFAH